MNTLKVFTYKEGKLIPAFNAGSFEDVDSCKLRIKWFFENRRSDQSTQFVIATPTEIVSLLTVDSI